MEFYRTRIIEIYISKNVIYARIYIRWMTGGQGRECGGRGRKGRLVDSYETQISHNDLENHDDFYMRPTRPTTSQSMR